MEQTFLDPEIKHLVDNFDKVFIIPGICKGTKAAVPHGVVIDETYSYCFESISGKIRILIAGLFSKLLYKEIVKHPSALISAPLLKRLIVFSGKAIMTRSWLVSFLSRNKLDPADCIFYTYWFEASTTGIGLVEESLPQITLISRAHGHDLYEERSIGSFIPLREQTLNSLDHLFCASEAGVRYIKERYPWFSKRCELARLGVEDSGFITVSSTDGVIRIVSCSVLIPLKRIDLLLKGIDFAARKRPEQKFEWHHFGIGPLKDKLEKMALEILPENVKSFFPGYTSIQHLMQFYREYPVDLFMHMSETEGGCPVAIQEALSCGMAIIATDVGGTSEIVSNDNGQLLKSNPSPSDISDAIYNIIDNPPILENKKRRSKQMWLEKCHADTNHLNFIACVKTLYADIHTAEIRSHQK